MSADTADLAVLYLARHAEGLAALRRFADSYRLYPAGIAHQLVVLYKGFLDPAALAAAQHVFGGIPHTALELDDSGFDVGSYVEAVRWLSHGWICPISTYTEIRAAGWLAMLAKRATASGVGLAGAMGSYESMYSSRRLYSKVHWLRGRDDLGQDPALHRWYREFLGDRWLPACALTSRLDRPAPIRDLRLALQFRPYWKRVMAACEPVDFTRYPRFPNPHIRTTAFVIPRERLLAYARDRFRTKDDAYAFESGFDGLTIQMRRAGLAALVVGRDDRDFDVADWPRSGTFRLGDQGNLLVTDGQSRKFDALDPDSRVTSVRFTWGDHHAPLPDGYPDLGQRFPRGDLGVR